MKTMTKLATMSALAMSLGLAGDAFARCQQGIDSISLTDTVIFPMHECTGAFPDWVWTNWHINEDDWRQRFEHPCSLGQEYPKLVNTAWLIATQPRQGPIPFPNLIPPPRAFHDHDDYAFTADGNDSVWHGSTKHIVIDGYRTIGEYQHFFFDEDESRTFCGLYDRGEPAIFVQDGLPPPGGCGSLPCIIPGHVVLPFDSDMVSERAITIIHEGWHAWGERNLNSDYKNSIPTGHEIAGKGALPQPPPGAPPVPTFCTNSLECDYFRAHPSSEFLPRQLVNAGRVTDAQSGVPLPKRTTFHSVLQVELEYACDLADFGAAFIPYSIREAAAETAKFDATTSFVNAVPFFCGSTRPLWTKDPGAIPPGQTTPTCLDQSRINCGAGSNGFCGADSRGGCGPDGCCVASCADADPSKQCLGLGTAGYSCGVQCHPLSGCCVAQPVPIKVRATQTFTGPLLCIEGQGFTPGAMVNVQYVNVPKFGGPVFANFAATVGADGSFKLIDESQTKAIQFGCTDAQAHGQVTVQAVEASANALVSETTIEADLWCANFTQPNQVNGGCQ